MSLYVQQNQPPGVPPLELTGERTLPDVPGRELLVSPAPGRVRVDRRAGRPAGSCSTWRAARATGRTCWPARPLAWSGSTAIPRRTSTPGSDTSGSNLTLRVGRGRDVRRAGCVRRGRVPTDDRARDRPAGRARALSPDPQAGRRRVRLDPERAEARARRATPSRTTPGTCGSTGPHEFAGLCRGAFADVEMLGLFHARKLRAARDGARARLGFGAQAARDHRRVLRPLHAGDRDDATSRSRRSGSTARSTSSRSAGPTERNAWSGDRTGAWTSPCWVASPRQPNYWLIDIRKAGSAVSQLRLGRRAIPGVLATIAASVVVLAPVTPAAAKRAARHGASTPHASTSRVWFPRDVLALGYATNLGAASPSQVMQIGIGLKAPNPSGEVALERAQQNPASPEYQHFLTPAQFDSRFGVPKTTFARMLTWLRSGGASVIETSGARNYVEVNATVKQVDGLFGTKVNRYSAHGHPVPGQRLGAQRPRAPRRPRDHRAQHARPADDTARRRPPRRARAGVLGARPVDRAGVAAVDSRRGHAHEHDQQCPRVAARSGPRRLR